MLAVTTEPLKSSNAGAIEAGKLSASRPSSWALSSISAKWYRRPRPARAVYEALP